MSGGAAAVTRDRFKTFETFRTAHAARMVASTSASATTPLLVDVDLERGADARKVVTPLPLWMATLDDIAQTQVVTITRALKRLEQVQRDQLIAQFDDQDDSDEREKEQQLAILGSDITTRLQSAFQRVSQVKALRIDTQAERHLRDNMVSNVAATLQTHSRKFQDLQRDYLERLRAREQFVNLNDSAFAMPPVTAFTVDHGFSSQQRARAVRLCSSIEQREAEIIALAKSVEQLADLFQQLSVLVVEQGTLLDHIESNCGVAERNTQVAVVQLRAASKSQRSSRCKLCIVLLAGLVLVAVCALIVVLAVKIK